MGRKAIYTKEEMKARLKSRRQEKKAEYNEYMKNYMAKRRKEAKSLKENNLIEGLERMPS